MWVPAYTLKKLLGSETASILCEHMGGISLYVPQTAHTEHKIAKLIGFKGMQALCAHFRGEYITVPNSGIQKERIQELLEKGMSKRSVAQYCGVTERYVYVIAGLINNKTNRDDQLTLLNTGNSQD